MAKGLILDMTNVKEGGAAFNKRRVPEGDYLAKVTKVDDATVKSDANKGAHQWLFTIVLTDKANATYPYYCQTQAENQLWKIRNLLVAAGITVPRKRVKVDPERLIGKTIAVTLQDAEYEGKEQSEIGAIFPPSEMNGGSDDVDEDEDEEEEEDETPAPKAKAKRRAPEPEPEEDEDDDDEEDEEEEEEPEPQPVVRKKRRPVPPPVDDDEDEEDEDDEEEEEPAPKKRAAKKAAPARGKRKVTDEELEELDIDDI